MKAGNPKLPGAYLTLQTKLSLLMAALLLVAGTVVAMIFEDHHTLAEAKLPQRYKVTVVLIARPDGGEKTKPFEPGADFALMADDAVMVVGRRENINRFE